MKKVNKLEKIVAGIVISDSHIPYQDNKVINCALEVADHLKDRLDYFVINGDFLDCYAISKFVKDPKRALEFQKELDKGKHILDKISTALPTATKKYYVEGNHEERIQKDKRINSHLYSLDMYSIPNMLELDKKGFSWIPMGKKLRRKNFVIYHGNKVSKHSAYTSKAELEENNFSGITGHTHRGGMHNKTTLDKTLVHAESFCSCRFQVADEYIKGVKNWQKGFLVVYENLKTGDFQIVPVEVKKGKAIFESKAFYG